MEDATKMMLTEYKPPRDERLRECLTRPFTPEQIQQRSGGKRGMFSYVPAALVKQRLNEAFDFKWSWEVNDFRIENNQCIVSGTLIASIDGEPIKKQGFGSKPITGEIGDDFKAASSDALKVAASLFGIGLHMYMENKPQQQQGPQMYPPPPPPQQQQRGYNQAPPPPGYQPAYQQQRPQQPPPQQWQQQPQQQWQAPHPQQQWQQPPPQQQWAPPPQSNVPPQIPIQNAPPPIVNQPIQPQQNPAPQMQQAPPPEANVINAPVNTEPNVSDIDDAKGIG